MYSETGLYECHLDRFDEVVESFVRGVGSLTKDRVEFWTPASKLIVKGIRNRYVSPRPRHYRSPHQAFEVNKATVELSFNIKGLYEFRREEKPVKVYGMFGGGGDVPRPSSLEIPTSLCCASYAYHLEKEDQEFFLYYIMWQHRARLAKSRDEIMSELDRLGFPSAAP
ncbi:MAG TPA: hypothetical protein VLA04_05770 [Verrucomicrobiae bacterium]|nr:hypothetical protein [Verrucomicrobiae bacterium]